MEIDLDFREHRKDIVIKNSFVLDILDFTMDAQQQRGRSTLDKSARDKNRKRAGKMQKKRIHVLQNPAKIAFRGWEAIPEPWSYNDCVNYIEWCHISKVFPLNRHNNHRRFNKVNLKYCTCPEFQQRCIEVYQVLYQRGEVHRNEIPLIICRMVWAEVKLKKSVDWRTVKSSPAVTVPTTADIPRGVLLFPDGGLSILRTQVEVPDHYATDDSSPDSDSDGHRPEVPANSPSAPGARTMQGRKRPRPRALAPAMLAAAIAEISNAVGPTLEPNIEEGGPSDMVVVDQPVPAQTTVETVNAPSTTFSLSTLRAGYDQQLTEKNALIRRLQEDLRIFQTKDVENQAIISEKDAEIQRLRNLLGSRSPVRNDNQEVDVGGHAQVGTLVDEPIDIDNVINTATVGVLEEVNTPVTRTLRRTFPPLDSERPILSTQETQDSLSFPTSSEMNDVGLSNMATEALLNETRDLKSKYDDMKERLRLCLEQYHQWKLACVWTVDRSRQMAMELQRILNTYSQDNERRDFGLTSWAAPDELFPVDKLRTKVVAGNQTVIDWVNNGWDYENAMSSHDLRGDPNVQSFKLWPKPAPFVMNNDQCIMCLNPFGPEGGYHLGSCDHLYHPICLISLMITRRRCSVCRAPFHERLYEMFGLVRYMPPHWECNPENSEDRKDTWGNDLVWSWRTGTHSVYKSQLSSQFGWENNPAEIVRVAHKLIPGRSQIAQGQRNFFYSCFGGHWNEATREFNLGPHPLGHFWKHNGERVSSNDPVALHEMMVALTTSVSEWRDKFQVEAVDFLLEEHSPATKRALEEMKNSQFMKAILDADGPSRGTRSRARKRLQLPEDDGPDDFIVLPLNSTSGTGASSSGAT